MPIICRRITRLTRHAPNFSITSIFYSTKTNANTPDTFKALEQGNLGAFLAGQPFYFFGPAYPTGRPYFDVSNVTNLTDGLPAIIIVYGHRKFETSFSGNLNIKLQKRRAD